MGVLKLPQASIGGTFMIVKTDVTPEEKSIIQSLAKAEGKSLSAYLKSRALCKSEITPEAMMRCIDIQSNIAKDINSISINILRNKAIYEAEILELLDRMTALEKSNAELVKEVRGRGDARKQKHKSNSPGGSKVQQQPRQKPTA